MKVGFFGTPDIASHILKRLCREHDVVFLVAPEDKRCGRNMQIHHCSSKELAACEDIPVLQPKSLKNPEFLEELKTYNADIFVVVAYGKLIPRAIFDLPQYGTINLHPSLLPLYRGAAPVEWAVINGESETGVTVQMINEQLDAGDIVLQEKIQLSNTITTGELYELVMPIGEELVLQSMEILSSGRDKLIHQDHGRATHCAKIDRETAHIIWNRDSSDIHNLVRGLNPKPAAWTTFRGMNIKIWKTLPFKDEEIELMPGELLKYHKKRLLAGTGSGILEILEIQPENKKRMDGLAFINGYRLVEKEKFE
ncbi:MAG: methionyl-tRNA formyltransferase [Spirochaetae bacterium HGW-Spirochaetae-5]|nr:MAG: methionyl-tRNA formyltransferase [Spirochaetae bacterium HGW-Spirochaetae-5]